MIIMIQLIRHIFIIFIKDSDLIGILSTRNYFQKRKNLC